MNRNPSLEIIKYILITLILSISVNSFAGDDEKNLLAQARLIFKSLPKDMSTPEYPIKPERVSLGRSLFFDPRISLDGTVSCARCHLPSLYGTDSLPKSIGVKDRQNPRNAPTVLNAALDFTAHWRGDRKNVEDQAVKALIGPPSFGQPDYTTAMSKISEIPTYVEMFRKAFPNENNPITADNWGKAIGAYERTLVTPSAFDSYIKGNLNALSKAAKIGLKKYIATGCTTCHDGVGIGGGKFMKFGLVEDYWKATGSKEPDVGRFDVTKNESDRYVFKVASLRNVAMTAPYFHDGSVRTLPEAVKVMARVQLGKVLTDQDVNDIVTFLLSLTGKLPKDFEDLPILPAGAFDASIL